MADALKHRILARIITVLAVALLCFGCTPAHTVKPLPDFVNKAIQPGDKIIVTTRDDETIEFVVREVSDEALIGKNQRIALADVVTLKKVSWKRPPSPCGGEKSLGCSVPLLVSIASDAHRQYGRHFYDACAQHDYCYRHGHITYGLDRDACDAEFLRNMQVLCPERSQSKFRRFLDAISTDTDSRQSCIATADDFHSAVRSFGESKFHISSSTYCEYDGPP